MKQNSQSGWLAAWGGRPCGWWLIAGCLLGTQLGAATCRASELKRFQASQIHMGTSFTIVLYAPDAATANKAVTAAFARIQQLDHRLSDFDSDSEVNQLSRQAPTAEPVPISDDLCRVLTAAQQLSRRTCGAFDVTVGPLSRLWRRARRRHQLPDPQRLAAARAAVGYQLLVVDSKNHTAKLLRPAMRLDLGGIAKGYAADEALAILRAHGICRAMINAGGDIATGDSPPGRDGWVVGIAPLKPDSPPQHFVRLANAAVATSGDAWQYVEIGGRRYSHILDPHTGMGLTTRSSVSVIAPTCMAADGLASAVSVLGPEKGLALIDATPATAALIVVLSDGRPIVHRSCRLAKWLIPPPAPVK